jgi:uncharacterized protein (TIGR00251 family)
VELHIRVRPGARKAAIVGVRNDELLVDIDAPAHEGKANLALVKFLAKALGASSAQVVIVSGQRGRSKVLRVLGAKREDVQQALGTGFDRDR